MREKRVCRCVEEAFQSKVGASRRPFAILGARPHYAPDLPFRLEHLALNVAIDPREKTVQGEITHRVRSVFPGVKRIRLDQIGLKIDEVRVRNKKVPFSVEGDALWIHLDSTGGTNPGEVFEFQIRYHAKNPRRGLYFTGPDAAYPQKPIQVWSQGQDEDNRWWFPTFDYPNQKATSEVTATVPKGFTAISNGALISKKKQPEGVQYHYRLGTPHVTYLICLTVGEFSEKAEKGPRGLPIQYFVAPGREKDGERAFGNTPKMIEVFEKRIGVPYPYEKYSQVAVQDFIFGGMENTSATTQTELTLHDARAHLDFSSDPLVSHELAHQWFGDLLTCRDWSHGWLNEGFATFMERVWIEEYQGAWGGLDEAKYYSYQDFKDYLEEDTKNYRRPIVCNTYIEPIDLFDTHLYQKGGLVLNLIRHLLGEELFWKTIQVYVTRHRGQNVETLDLIRAIDDVTGRNFRRFFDEWVYGAGYPEFELTYQWHEDKGLAEIVIEQKQTEGQASVTKDGAATPLFHLPVVIELALEEGRKQSQTVEISEARERVFLPAASKPLMVRFDPGHNIPKTLKFPRPKEMLLHQLKKDPDCMGRIEAAQELVKISDSEVVEALGKAAKSDEFWGVQAEAASALAEIRTDSSREALIAALGTKNPKARKAVVNALGTFRDEKAAKALRKIAEKDDSYFVEADATYAWAMTRIHPVPRPKESEISKIEDFLFEQLKKESYREVIRVASIRALGELPGVGRGECPRSMSALMEWTARGKPMEVRFAAVVTLGRIARSAVPSERARILELFGVLADEDEIRLRLSLIQGLRVGELVEGLGVLEKIREWDLDGRVRRHALAAMDHLRSAGSQPEAVASLKAALEKLEEEYRKVKSTLEEMKGAQKQKSV